jgi:putative transposase
LKFYNSEFLNEFRVIAKVREFQFWKRKPFSIELRSDAVFLQKLEYIYENPLKVALCKFDEEYYYHQPSFMKHEMAILVF